MRESSRLTEEDKSSVPGEEGPESGLTSAEAFACALHEVSNALTVLLGWLDVASSCESLEDVRTAVGVAREHARRGQVMARRAIGADVSSLHEERTGTDIVEFAAMSVRPEAQARQVSIVTSIGEGTFGAVQDDDTVLQILTNLLLNGIAFSPDSGTVTLGVERRGGMLAFSVADEGPGIPAARRSRLFSSRASTRSGGAGIGLPHSRRLAREGGGDLHLVPTPRGALFELVWPVAATSSVRPTLGAESRRDLAGARILAVEDDSALSALIELSFGARGAEVIVVSDAAALDAVLAGRPMLDLVLLDLSPIETRLASALAEIARVAPQAPVVLMSGQPTGVPAEAEGRVARWVRKPFDLDELIGTVRDLLPRSASDSGRS